MAEEKHRHQFQARFGTGTPCQLTLTDPPSSLKPFGSHNQSNLTTRLRHTKNWLHIDWTYPIYHEARSNLLNKKRDEVIQYWTKNELKDDIDSACNEVLEMVVADLTTQYPQFFSKKGSMITNALTGELFDLADDEIKPLEIAARFIGEDLNILLPLNRLSNGSFTLSTSSDRIDNFHLVASATLFPAGWILKERIGHTIQQLHEPVPQWKDRLGRAVPNAIQKVAFGSTHTGKVEVDKERLAVFLQADRPNTTLDDLLFAQDSANFFPTGRVEIDELLLRRERQCFRRIEKKNGAVFSVRTYVVPLKNMESSEVMEFARQAQGLMESHADYKQRQIWYPCVQNYLREHGINSDTCAEDFVSAVAGPKGLFETVCTVM
jgi:hypothetical protein